MEKRRIERCINVIVSDSYTQLHHEVMLNQKFTIEDLDIEGPLLAAVSDLRAHRYRIMAQVQFIRAAVPQALADIETKLFKEKAWPLVETMLEQTIVQLGSKPTSLGIARAPDKTVALARGLRQCVMLIAQARMNAQIASMYEHTDNGYERQKFKELVMRGGLKLHETTRWLLAALSFDHKKSLRGDYALAVTHLVQHLPCLPEVFALDYERLRRLHSEFKALVAVCAYCDANGGVDLECIHKYKASKLQLHQLPLAEEPADSPWNARLARAVQIRILFPERKVRVARLPALLKRDLAKFMDEIARMTRVNYKTYADDLYAHILPLLGLFIK